MGESMIKKLATALALSAAAVSAPAFAQDAPADDFSITGSATLTSQYRLRGISQSDEDIAVQGGITVTHSSGLYVGTWASSLGGFGTFGGSNTEVDAIVGYSTAVGGATLDGGLIWYFYPGTSGHDYGEVYGSVSGPLGPLKAKLGANYAFSDNSLGGDNLWIYTDWAFPVEGTPLTLKAHAGYTTGDAFLAGPDGDYFNYAVGVDVAIKNLTLNISYVDTDLPNNLPTNLFFASGTTSGHDIVDGAVVATLTASF